MQAEESEIYPLALMDIDESLIDNNIGILVQFVLPIASPLGNNTIGPSSHLIAFLRSWYNRDACR